MRIETLCENQALSALDYRCTATPHDNPYVEQFVAHSVSYVRKGSFGCRTRGRNFDLVPGSLLIGRADDEYLCTHDHHCGGDECLSFQLTPDFVDELGDGDNIWRAGAVPPLPAIMVLGELAWSAALGDSAVGLDEIGLKLAQRFVSLAGGRVLKSGKPDARQRRRVIEAALWLDENSHDSRGLAALATDAGFSQYHFLRLFTHVVGVSPHQYRLRTRLRRAVHLLARNDRSITDVAYATGFNDLSNFVRTFHRAAGMSPGRFRRLAREGKQDFPRLAWLTE